MNSTQLAEMSVGAMYLAAADGDLENNPVVVGEVLGGLEVRACAGECPPLYRSAHLVLRESSCLVGIAAVDHTFVVRHTLHTLKI